MAQPARREPKRTAFRRGGARQPPHGLRVSLGARALAAALALLPCFTPCPAPGADLPPAQRPLLRIGVDRGTVTGYDSNDIRASFELWVDELAQKLKVRHRVELIVFDDPADIVAALKRRALDLVGLTSLNYLAVRRQTPLDPLWTNQRPSGIGVRYVLVVAASAGARDLSQLRGAKLIIATGRCGALPRVWVQSLLAGKKLGACEAFFGALKEVTNPSRAILPVFFGQAHVGVAEATAFATMVELNPQVGRELRILHRSELLLDGITCFRRDYEDLVLRERLCAEAGRLHEYPRGRQIMTLYKVHKLTPFEEAQVETVKQLLQETGAGGPVPQP